MQRTYEAYFDREEKCIFPLFFFLEFYLTLSLCSEFWVTLYLV